MPVENIECTALNVKELDSAIRFYGELLQTRFDVAETKTEDGDIIRFAISPCGLELVENKGTNSYVDGLRSVVLKVNNLDEFESRLSKYGFIPFARIDTPNFRERLFEIRGVRLSFAEYDRNKTSSHGLFQAAHE